MTVFLIIYAVIALVAFVALEVLGILDVEQKNEMFKIPVYRVNHIKCLMNGIFFPIFLLSVLISVTVKCFLERRK